MLSLHQDHCFSVQLETVWLTVNGENCAGQDAEDEGWQKEKLKFKRIYCVQTQQSTQLTPILSIMGHCRVTYCGYLRLVEVWASFAFITAASLVPEQTQPQLKPRHVSQDLLITTEHNRFQQLGQIKKALRLHWLMEFVRTMNMARVVYPGTTPQLHFWSLE